MKFLNIKIVEQATESKRFNIRLTFDLAIVSAVFFKTCRSKTVSQKLRDLADEIDKLEKCNPCLDKKYWEWINKYYPSPKEAKNKCNEAVRAIVFDFPELTVQVGYANGTYHCWARTEKGNIIDPTMRQFTSPIKYTLIAERFLEKDEIEPSTGAIFLKNLN